MVYDPEIVAPWSWCSSIYIFVEVLTGSLFYWVEGPSPKSRIHQDPAVSPITVHSWAFQTRLASLPCISKTRDLSTQDRPNPPYSEVSPPIGSPHYDTHGELNASSFMFPQLFEPSSVTYFSYCITARLFLYLNSSVSPWTLRVETVSQAFFCFTHKVYKIPRAQWLFSDLFFFSPQSSSTFYWCPSLQSLLHSWSFWSFS